MVFAFFTVLFIVDKDEEPVVTLPSEPKIIINGEEFNAKKEEEDRLRKEAEEKRIAEAKAIEEWNKIVYHITIDLNRPAAIAWMYAQPVVEASKKYDVPVEIILAVIEVESEFNQEAVSWAGALGSMQVVPFHWEAVVDYDPLDFNGNIMLGTFVLSRYKGKLGDYESALKAYNVGITNFRKGKKLGAQKRYITKIDKVMQKLEFVINDI